MSLQPEGFGGAMVAETLRHVDPNIPLLTAAAPYVHAKMHENKGIAPAEAALRGLACCLRI